MGLRVGEARQDFKSLASNPGQGGDLRKADQGPCLSQFGEAGERKESKEAGGQWSGEVGSSKEGRSETQEQGIAVSGTRPRQGKVVASLMEALEGQVSRGGGRRRNRS